MEKVWKRVGLHSSRKKRSGNSTSDRPRPADSICYLSPSVISASQEAEYQNIQSIREAELQNERIGAEKSTLRSSYIIRNGDNLILVERRRRRRRRSSSRASSANRHANTIVEERSRSEKRRPPSRLKLFGIKWPLHSSDRSNSVSITRRFCRGKRSSGDNELYRSNSFKFERFSRDSQASLCADYSLPVDCVGTAPRPRSFHEVSAPKVEFVEAYCTPRDNARRKSPLQKRRNSPRGSCGPSSSSQPYFQRDFATSAFAAPHCSRSSDFSGFESYRRDYSFGRRTRDYQFSGRQQFDRSPRCADIDSARRTDFDLTRPTEAGSPETSSDGSRGSPPEPAPSHGDYRGRRSHTHHQYQSESSSDLHSSSADEEEDFGDFDAAGGGVPSLHSPDSLRSYANAPRRNPSPYYYGDLFKKAPSPQPTQPRRYRKSASLDAPNVAQRPSLPKRFSVAEDGLSRELERSSSSEEEEHGRLMAPRRNVGSTDSRSVFYIPAPAPKWSGLVPAEMTHQLYETAFDSKIARSDDDLDDFDRVSNHPALLQSGRCLVSSASSAFEAVESKKTGRRKVTMKTDSVRRSKLTTKSQKKESETVAVLSQNIENMHIKEEEDRTNSQLPLRGYTPSPPSTAPLPTKFPQSKDYLAMNSIKSAPNLPAQPAHPRLKDLRLPVKSLKAREALSSQTSLPDEIKISSINDDASENAKDTKDNEEKEQTTKNTEEVFLEIKGRPTSDSETPNMNRVRGSRVAGPILEFKNRPETRRPRLKYSSTESMATSSSGGSMESIRSSTSEGNRSTSSSDSRNSSTLSSHSSDSGGHITFPKHKSLIFTNHHPSSKLHILSPISDKSSQEQTFELSENNKNNNSQKVSPDEMENIITDPQPAIILSKPKRRAQQSRLLNLTLKSSLGDSEIQGSDSGISIHSREGSDSRNAFVNFLKSHDTTKSDDDGNMTSGNFDDLPFDMPKLRIRKESQRNVTADLSSLPFDMPKLRRKLRSQSFQSDMDCGGKQIFSSQNNQDQDRAKLSLNLGGSGGVRRGLSLQLPSKSAEVRDIVDASVPLDRQGWYHGSITRVEAEDILRGANEGAFLVRNSESAKHDFSLSLKSVCGFMHLRIRREINGWALGEASSARDTAFDSVPALMKYYTSHSERRLPVRGAEHMALVRPLNAILL